VDPFWKRNLSGISFDWILWRNSFGIYGEPERIGPLSVTSLFFAKGNPEDHAAILAWALVISETEIASKWKAETDMKGFRQLKVLQKSHQLVLALYRITASFPPAESHGLTPQIRRAAVSIPSNIAAGCGRGGDAELARFCCIARGSASELEYPLLQARDLKLIQPDDHELLERQTTEIKRMLTVFVQKLTAES